ncbi:unnamed protein product [Blepharisma stoltei]|uniref:Ribosome assembly protein 1 n=1 Tax=Blepharisma stoltei TaxID=1481888 RepID=A0AAU9JN71_9CILI|nr:unnamed protein product [Blepharisma stoltei]
MNWKKQSEILELRSHPELIRNISILAHVDHGKTSLSDSLISSNQIISPKLAGKLRYLDSRPDEQARCITMKSSSISLIYPMQETSYLINLIDSPGHVDFSSEVAAALRVCDGGLLLIDVVEGFCAQTYTVLKQSWDEGIRVCLVLNKIDRLINELRMTPEDAYKHLNSIVEKVNAVVSGFYYEKRGRVVDDESDEESFFFKPELGNVAFSSALDRWAFTLREFADIYAKKMGFNPKALCSCFWGEFYYNPKSKKVVKKKFSEKCQPMFVQFVLEPLWRIYDCIMINKNPEKLTSMLEKIDIAVSQRDMSYLNNEPRTTLQAVMSSWMPIDKSILSMIVRNLPSPIKAQGERIKVIAPALEEKCPELFTSVSACDQAGPISVFVSKMVSIDPSIHINRKPGEEIDYNETLIAFSRVFSGTLTRNTPIYVIENKGDVIECLIEKLYLLMGQYLIPVDSAPAGTIVGIGSLEHVVFKTGTLSSIPDCPTFTPIPHKASPIVKVSVQPVNLYDMNSMVQGLQMLDRSDNSIEVYVQDNGEHIIAVCGEVHLQRCIKDLEENFAKVPVTVSEPLVSFKETIVLEGKQFTDITPNKLCSMTVSAYPIPEHILNFLDEKQEVMKQIFGVFAKPSTELKSAFIEEFKNLLTTCPQPLKTLIEEHLFSFGPRRAGNNMLIYKEKKSILESSEPKEETKEESESGDENGSSTNASKFSGCDFDLPNAFIAGFDLANNSGPLCGEPLRGVCFVIEEVKISNSEETKDPYGPFQGQVICTMRDACRGAVLANSPRIVEGMYECTFQTTQEHIGRLYAVINRKRGKIVQEILTEGTDMYVCKTFLPVVESFGFSDELRIMTSGAVMPQLTFSHWQMIVEDPFYTHKTQEQLEEFGEQPILENLPKSIINKVRRRKGLATDEKLVIHADKQRTLTKMR